MSTREPLVIRAAIVAFVTAVIGLLVAFGVVIPEDTSENIVNLVIVVFSLAAPLITAALARGKVTPIDDSGYIDPAEREV